MDTLSDAELALFHDLKEKARALDAAEQSLLASISETEALTAKVQQEMDEFMREIGNI